MLATELVELDAYSAADVASELSFFEASDLGGRDDVVLDRWIASLTSDQFERVLESLARPYAARSASVD